MDIRKLELFLAVMDCGSITQAGRRMYLSAGAISQQMHNLADDLGTELFVRNGRRLQPTPAAVRLAEHARSILATVHSIEQEFAGRQPDHDHRPFHFATGVTTLIYRLGGPLRRLRKEYPHVQLQITVASTEEILAGLVSRRFDLGLISLPVDQQGLSILPLYEEELVLLRPSATRVRNHRIGQIAAAELAGMSFLLYPERSNMRRQIDRFFASLGLQPHVVMEADDTEAIKRLVESGFGCSILPLSAVSVAGGFYQMFRIEGHCLTRQQALAMVATPYPRALRTTLANSLQTLLQQEDARWRSGAGGRLSPEHR